MQKTVYAQSIIEPKTRLCAEYSHFTKSRLFCDFSLDLLYSFLPVLITKESRSVSC